MLRIFTINLLLFIFVVGTLLPAMMSLSLFNHRQTVFDSYDKTSTTTLSLTPGQFAALNWNDEKEFVFNNRHYDLFSILKKGNAYLISCLADQKEDQLLSKLDKETSHKNLSKKVSFPRMIFNYCRSTCLPSIYASEFIRSEKSPSFWNYISVSISSPPPRFMS